MAASLSYYPNWDTTHGHNILNFSETLDASPTFIPEPPQEVDNHNEASSAELLFDFLLPESSFLPPPLDPLFNSGDFVPILPPPECPAPKRQKLCHNDDHFPEITQNCFGVFIPNPPLLQDFKPPQPHPTLLEFSPACYSEVDSWVGKKSEGGGGGRTLSAQSIAARERRRRITEKTQQLGKLVPGGQKMNTAEMFQAAYKYIKFMQTQVAVLHSCLSSQECMNEEVGSLVGSVLVQEKLYSNDKCLVPKKFIQSLPNSNELLTSISPPN